MPDIKIVGILNVTPDSYYDGGEYDREALAVERAGQMLEEGVDIIEIGGESTGPYSKDVSEQEELARTISILIAIKKKYPNATLSIDTYKAAVAHAAIARGVQMVNDVTAGRGDPEMFKVIAESSVSYVMMYSKDSTPRTTIEDRDYTDVIDTIRTFLLNQIVLAEAAGVSPRQIIIDPGLGHFVSSKPEYSFEIIDRLKQLSDIAPIFVSPSRKSFLAGPENHPPEERLPATLRASSAAAQNGASYIRTHDIADTAKALRIYRRLESQGVQL